MNITVVSAVLGWCLVINLFILLLWAGFLLCAADWTYKIQTHWISITREQFNYCHFFLFGFYKLIIFVFFLTPYISLRLIS